MEIAPQMPPAPPEPVQEQSAKPVLDSSGTAPELLWVERESAEASGNSGTVPELPCVF
jgi:hypothetical protein